MRAQAFQVHLDAAALGVENGPMAEGAEVEVSAQHGVEPGQEVEVEAGGDALGVVVGRDQHGGIFQQVKAQKKSILRPQAAPQHGEKLVDFVLVKVADGRSQEGN